VLEQLPDGDAGAVDPVAGDEPREVGVDRGVEGDLPLLDQLEDDGRDEHLRVARDPHLAVDLGGLVGREVADTGRDVDRRAVRSDHRGERRGVAGVDERLHPVLQRPGVGA
jgi:hypothetical protein